MSLTFSLLALLFLVGPGVIESRSVNSLVSSSSDSNGNTLVKLDPTRYALAGPALSLNDWAAVNVNGQAVTIYLNSSCQEIQRQLSSLSENELSIIKQTKSLAENEGPFSNNNNGMSSFFQDGGSYSSSSSFGSSSTIVNDGIVVSANSEDDKFTYAGNALPNSMKMLIRHNGVVTFVYKSNELSMKPVHCLYEDEQTILQQVQASMLNQRTKMNENMDKMHQEMNSRMAQHQQNMQSFNQRMQEFNQNMQSRMSEMSRSMSESFGHGFPFNNYQSQQQVEPTTREQRSKSAYQQQQQQQVQYPTDNMFGNYFGNFPTGGYFNDQYYY